jgi:hypothetical protein
MSNRVLKESICMSETIDALTWFEEVFFHRLMVKCDDFGRCDGRLKIIKGHCFPLKDITEEELDKALNKLSLVGLIRRYTVSGHPYIQFVTWEKHQTVRNKKSKYPSIEEGEEQLPSIENNCMQMNAIASLIQSNPIQSESNPNPIQSLEEGEKTKRREKRFVPPTLEEVQAYISENNYIIDAQKFIDYYQSNGWIVGKTKMKDWKATVRGWERREQEHFRKTQKEEEDPMGFLPF